MGNQTASFFSHDGATWLSAGPAFSLGKLPAEALYGIAVTSHQSSRGRQITEATFEKLSVVK